MCNQHYSKQNDVDLAKSYAECPIVCKLADFGLSRSPDMQTSTFLKPKTESPCRGTPVFMAPEILLEDLKFAGQEDLKKADIWALGLMMFSMINPNLSNPYRAESLFSRNKQRSKDIKHFTTASEIKSYQGHLLKHKPREMITQYACNKSAS